MHSDTFEVFDALYGAIQFAPPVADLIRQPLMQRLRQVRLSNIDSLQMPGIANISRFEHALGSCYLASRVGFSTALDDREFIALQSAALIHDTAITPFGHLVEEALQYVEAEFNHEAKWSVLLSDAANAQELGGLETQIYLGRASGLKHWAMKTFGGSGSSFLSTIVESIQGRGKYGAAIASTIDLDNLDNVTRIAFHMGLRPDAGLPFRLAEAMAALAGDGRVLFDPRAVDDIKAWIALRQSVYEHLMPSETDFCGKLMLLWSAVEAFRTEELDPSTSWMLTDSDFLARVRDCGSPLLRETVDRWLMADLWDSSGLLWLQGGAPSFAKLMTFVEEFSESLGRRCFGYRIKDKRTRRISARLTSGEEVTVGEESDLWLLGIASPTRKTFTAEEQRRLARAAESAFGCRWVRTDKTEAALF